MTITIKNIATIHAEGTRNHGNCKEVFCKTTGKFYTSLSDAAHSVKGSVGTMSCAMKHRNGVYKGMKWCYVADIEAHLDDIATDIRENLEKVMVYDALMTIKEKVKKEEAIRAEHEAKIADIRQQIEELQNELMHEMVLSTEAEARISTLKETFWEMDSIFRKVRCISTRYETPEQLVVGNDYYIKTTTIEYQDGTEYVEVYRDPLGTEFVGRLCLYHFSDMPFCDRI